MQSYQIWKSKEVKNVLLKIIGQEPDGTIVVSFAMSHFVPKSTHKFEQWYLEQYYENTGEVQNWIIDSRLQQFA